MFFWGRRAEGLLKMLARFSNNEGVTCLEKNKNAGGLTEDAGQVLLRTPSPKRLRTPGPVEDPES